MIFRRLLGLWKLRRFETKLSEVNDSTIVNTWRSLTGDQHQDVVLLEGPANISPLTFGIFSPRLVVPAGLSDHLSNGEIRAVLAHELSHLQNRDALLGMIQCLVHLGGSSYDFPGWLVLPLERFGHGSIVVFDEIEDLRV